MKTKPEKDPKKHYHPTNSSIEPHVSFVRDHKESRNKVEGRRSQSPVSGLPTLTPPLRFREFEKEGNWEQIQLSTLAKITTGNKDTINKKQDGKYPFFVRSKTVEKIDTFSYDGEAVLTAGDGDIGKIFHYLNGKFDYHQRVYCIYDFSASLYGKYFYYYFSENFYGRVIRLSAKNTVNSVRMPMISEMEIPLPSIPEQQKIADCLTSLDDHIQAQTQKLEAYKTHKTALLQQLFPSPAPQHVIATEGSAFFSGSGAEGGTWQSVLPTSQDLKANPLIPPLRFKEFEKERNWEQIQLSALAKITTGNKDTINKKQDGKYPFFVRSKTVEKIDTFSYDGEAVLTAGDGDIGKIFHYLNGKFDYHQRVYCIYDFSASLYGKYFYYYFSENFYERVIRLSAKNTVNSVRMPMISEMEIPLPSRPEQQKIADCLTSLDDLIQAQTKKIELLKQHKTALMQNLFPKVG